MVIFHCYVSLPEGNNEDQAVNPCSEKPMSDRVQNLMVGAEQQPPNVPQ